ncbi:uncharacterized protein PHACADRAFT_157079 [Phanerochaete carnosa HHB-10118-sp]|uniref:Uncharacterized protein n=1 Tax=Phanerochaete carnosa (strain HHB-10118-sp) TaxID=650164 RepID=K5WQY0_PHACS|nr:uncharacterized protein PHACADRAFT_157079 [Phanerochaete carnosa HHB-10118-sp]EKM61860.1 hypothetical protein PHACADRAFT_157079 [Phanerochaete carnosa HHB-10118-sp]
MAFYDNLAAVVEPRRLSLYTLPPDGSPPLVINTEIMCFDLRVTSAAIEFSTECSPRTERTHSGSQLSIAIYVAVCGPYGMHVYTIPPETVDGQHRAIHL